MNSLARFFSFLLVVSVSIQVIAQTPNAINYQGVVRDGNGQLLTNTALSAQFTIKQNGPAGSTVYRETHSITTNDYGLFTALIGQGSAQAGDFTQIDWGSSSMFLKVEVDNGSGWTDLGTTQLVSVPYALYAKEAGNGGSTYQAGTGIDINGNTISNTAPDRPVTITGGGATTVSGSYPNFTISSTDQVDDADNNPTNEIQNLTISGNTLSISQGNSVTLPGGTGGDNWGNQVVQSDATLDGNGTNANPLSLARQGATSGEVLKWDGTAWIPATDQVDDADNNSSNELQNLALNGYDLSISQGNTITLPTDTSHWEKAGNYLYTIGDSVGIGVDTPQASLHIGSGESFFIGDTMSAPNGSAMLFDANKGAFRVGSVVNFETSWDADSIGVSSFATGVNTKAKGVVSTAMGSSTEAHGPYSTSMGFITFAMGIASVSSGQWTVAVGNYSTAMGHLTRASGFASTAMGVGTVASGSVSTALGNYTNASGDYSTAMGSGAIASGLFSTAMGVGTVASGSRSTAMGWETVASGSRSTAMGVGTVASGNRSTAMGWETVASDSLSTAMGSNTKASGLGSTAIGIFTTASGSSSTAMGESTIASGGASTAMGWRTVASGSISTAMGDSTIASGYESTAMGFGSRASGDYSTAMGVLTVASGSRSTAMGVGTVASGNRSTAMGWETVASDSLSTAMGSNTKASGLGSTAIGIFTTASGSSSTAMGESTIASGGASTAMGWRTVASGSISTAMGDSTIASGYESTAMGFGSRASGDYSTAMGVLTVASGSRSTAMGWETVASGSVSTAMGSNTTASGDRSLAAGVLTTAPSYCETVIGRYNTSYTPAGGAATWNASDRLFVIGNGTAATATSNAMVVLKNGNTGIGNNNPEELLHVGTTTGDGIQIGTFETIKDGGINRLDFNASLCPAIDNIRDLGSSTLRWDDVYATNGVIQTSDGRDKESILTLDYGLQTLLQLKPVSFVWKEGYTSGGRKLGFLAQDLLSVIPEVVKTEDLVHHEDGTSEMVQLDRYGVYYSDLIPVLVKGIQEQQETIAIQEQNITEQANELQTLKQQIQSLQQQLQNLQLAIENLQD